MSPPLPGAAAGSTRCAASETPGARPSNRTTIARAPRFKARMDMETIREPLLCRERTRGVQRRLGPPLVEGRRTARAADRAPRLAPLGCIELALDIVGGVGEQVDAGRTSPL